MSYIALSQRDNDFGDAPEQAQDNEDSEVAASGDRDPQQQPGVTRKQLWGLYLSHFLSTWNARSYEFAAILFTASAYPDTLTASSIRGILTTLSTLALSSAVGRWADQHPSRLQTLRIGIFVQRILVILACGGWISIVGEVFVEGGFSGTGVKTGVAGSGHQQPFAGKPVVKGIIFAAVLLLGIGERLSAVGNMMVMERDWVPAIAATEPAPFLLSLNASMRRIDLTCKLLAPLSISVLALVASSVRVTAVCIAVINAVSVGIEWHTAYRVYRSCPSLRVPKAPSPPPVQATRQQSVFRSWTQGLSLFFSTEIWLPSLSLALLYFPVLSFSASMLTFLLNAGFPLSEITIAQTFSTLVEVFATVASPWGVQMMERKQPTATAAAAAGIERMGLWGLWWQFTNLIPVTLLLFTLPTSGPPAFPSAALFIFLALSRMGLWIFDLSAQTLVQTHVPEGRRSEYSGVEMGFISAAELAQWVVTGVWAQTEDFKWLATAGTVAVGASLLAYMVWLRGRRGHLVHWEKVRWGECGN